MSVKDFYDEIGANYNDVLVRLNSEMLIDKIVKKFGEDPSFKQLENALENKNVDLAFRAAHTLKGICLNLGFDQMSQDAIDITEILRAGKLEGTQDIFERIKKNYNKTIECLKQLD